MKIFRKNFLNIGLILSITFLFCLIIFISFKKVDQNFKFELINYLESKSFGFSSVLNLKKENDDFRTYKVPLYFINSIKNIISYKINEPNFEKIYLDIKFEKYLQILKDKKTGDHNGYLVNPKFVDADINFNGTIYKSKLRLKGGTDHYTGNRRFSFRVKLKKNKSIFGFRNFSVHKPSSRQFPYDYVFNSLARGAGNISQPNNFAEIIVNGQNWGIMQIEEHFDSSFLEKQKRKDSMILQLVNDKKSELKTDLSKTYQQLKIKNYPQLLNQVEDWYKLSSSIYSPQLFKEKNYFKNTMDRKSYTYISNQLLNQSSEIFDQSILIKSILLCTLWGNYHAIININARYYFNPYTLKLELIATDQAEFNKIKRLEDIDHAKDFLKEAVNFKKKLDKKIFEKNYNTLNKIINESKIYFKQASDLFPVDQLVDLDILTENKNSISYQKIEDYLNYEVEKIPLDIFTFRENSEIFPKHIYFNHFTNGDIKIYNLLPDDVKITQIFIKEKNKKKVFYNYLENDEIIVTSYLKNQKPKIIQTDFLGNLDKKINIETKYYDSKKNHKNSITLSSQKIFNPLIKEIIECGNCVEKIDNNNYVFKKGFWKIDSLLVFNGNLKILPGTILKFSKESGIIVNGNLNAVGEPKRPIIMDALNTSWQGIYVYNGKNKSYLENIIFKNLTGLNQGLLQLTGSINFYKSDVNFLNVLIENNNSEDAINLVNSNFEIRGLHIKNTLSDGIDLDYSNGSIQKSIFFNIKGDAIDTSGSNVVIKEVSIESVGDKAISVGENSNVDIDSSELKKMSIGVVSKDGSSVLIKNTNFNNYKLFSIMSYNKKNFYGPSKIIVKNSNFNSKKLFLRQHGSYMTVDDQEIMKNYLDVKKLYENSTIKN